MGNKKSGVELGIEFLPVSALICLVLIKTNNNNTTKWVIMERSVTWSFNDSTVLHCRDSNPWVAITHEIEKLKLKEASRPLKRNVLCKSE